MSAAEPPRLTPTQRLHEVTMQALSRRPSEPESSVTLARNAKGDTQIEVVIRGTDPDKVLDTCRHAYDELRAIYPHSSETNGGEA